MKLLPWLAVTIPACPLLVEVFPDPTDVLDQDGEFVEVRLDATFRADTLTLFMDGKAAVRVPYPEGNRLVGIISHVDKLEESIPQKLRVTSTEHGSTLSLELS